jgi:hypothetical protein
MNAMELRALERIQADTIYLARLLERTMVEDALVIARGGGDSTMHDDLIHIQSVLFRIRTTAKKLEKAQIEAGMLP